LAKSRAARNRERIKQFFEEGWKPSRDLEPFINLSEEYLEDSLKHIQENERCAELAQKSLYYSMWAGEKLELEKAQFDIRKNGRRENFFIVRYKFFRMDKNFYETF
jgi:hypothetical protein